MALSTKMGESGSTLNAHEFIDYELKFDLNNPQTPTNKEIISMLDGRGDALDNEPIEEVNNVQFSDVLVDRVGFKDVESTPLTLKHFF